MSNKIIKWLCRALCVCILLASGYTEAEAGMHGYLQEAEVGAAVEGAGSEESMEESGTEESGTEDSGGKEAEREENVITVPEPLENLTLYATSAVLMDADSGRVLYEKNGFSRMAMASTTKIMTCIVTLENCSLDAEAEVSSYAASMPKVKLYVRQGEKYTIRELLYSLMLESHNDSAVVIAEHVGKELLSEELRNKSTSQYTAEESKQAVAAFAEMMNQKALDLGCRDTWFITPNGLDATQTFKLEDGTEVVKEHSTTAADLATIMAYCIQKSPRKDRFLEITGTSAYSFAANGRSFSCTNHNAFLNMMDGALSGKTGFTNKAGYCYVGALERDDRTFTVALLACGWPNNKTYKWSDTRELMEYGLSHYAYHSFSEVAIDTARLKPVPVLDGCTERLGDTAYVEMSPVVSNAETADDSGGLQKSEIEAAPSGGLLLREDEHFDIRYTLPEVLKAPVTEGTQVGKIEYLLGENVLKVIPIIAKYDVNVIDFKWCLQQIWKRYIFS